MVAPGFDGAQEDVPVLASDHGEVCAGFELMASPDLLRNHEMAFGGECGCHPFRFSYRPRRCQGMRSQSRTHRRESPALVSEVLFHATATSFLLSALVGIRPLPFANYSLPQ